MSFSIGTTYQIGIIQAKGYRKLYNLMFESLKEYGLTMNDWAVLGLIYENNEITQKEISKIMDVKTSLITLIMKTLNNKGFIKQSKLKTDKRFFKISITKKALELIPKIELDLKIKLRKILGDTSQIELLTYLKVLSTIAESKL